MSSAGPTRRIVLFAHYDRDAEVKRYVLHHLKALRALAERLVLISTSRLSQRSLTDVSQICDKVYIRENRGLDFASWAFALEREHLGAYDELLLTNSSVLGPVRPLAEVFDRMSAEQCDFWGLTEGGSPTTHLQSYFLVFRRAAIGSKAFSDFWASVLPYRSKAQVIYSYELGLTRFFVEQGLRAAALFSYEEVLRRMYGRLSPLRGAVNPVYHFAVPLLEMGFPYFKIEAARGVALHPRPLLLRRAAEHARQHLLRRALTARGYDLSLVEYDPKQLAPTLR